MAGHSKWKNIRIRKGKQDALRGKLFTKLSREIIIAARAGGDPETNSRLRAAIAKARENSLPVENIKRCIQKGTGEIEGENYEELTYEGYGPGGAAVIVEVTTENRNRTVADLRHAFSKNGGNLSESGSVSWQFRHCGEITVPRDRVTMDEDEFVLAALDAGADDVEADEEEFTLTTPVESLHATGQKLRAMGIEPSEIGLTWKPTNMATPSPADMQRLVKLLDALEELDDVKDTYVNVEITDEILQEA